MKSTGHGKIRHPFYYDTEYDITTASIGIRQTAVSIISLSIMCITPFEATFCLELHFFLPTRPISGEAG